MVRVCANADGSYDIPILTHGTGATRRSNFNFNPPKMVGAVEPIPANTATVEPASLSAHPCGLDGTDLQEQQAIFHSMAARHHGALIDIGSPPAKRQKCELCEGDEQEQQNIFFAKAATLNGLVVDLEDSEDLD